MALHCISAPEGLAAPRLLSIDDTTLRIVWTAPVRPNGEVTGYFIYLDGTKIDTEMTTPGSYLLQNLRPYTVYTIQVRESSESLTWWITVYPKKYAHGFVVLCFVVVMQSFIMNSHEVFIHIHQGCFAGTGAIVRLPNDCHSASEVSLMDMGKSVNV